VQNLCWKTRTLLSRLFWKISPYSKWSKQRNNKLKQEISITTNMNRNKEMKQALKITQWNISMIAILVSFMSPSFSWNTLYDIRRLRRRQNAKYFFSVLHVIYEMTCGIESVKVGYFVDNECERFFNQEYVCHVLLSRWMTVN
jgi:hypothetical protein